MLGTRSRLLRRVGVAGLLAMTVLVAASCGSGSGSGEPAVSRPIASSTSEPIANTTTTSTATSESSAIAEPSTTTTSRPPRTTTSRPPRTSPTEAPTTTPAPPTTTTGPVNSSEETSAPWGWIIAVLLVGAAAAVIIILLNRRSRQRVLRAWRQKTRGTLEAVLLVQRLLPTSGGDTSPPAHWEAVRTRITEAANSLDRAAADAPNNETRRAASSCADALRAAAFAVDADRLLRESGRSPTASELADADIAIRQSSVAVQGSLERLGAFVGTSPQPDGT